MNIFLPRLLYLINIFLLRLLYVINIFLPQIAVCDKYLSAKTVHKILLPAKTCSRRQNHTDSLCRKPHFMEISLERISKRSGTVSAEAKYDGQSRQKSKNWSASLYPVLYSRFITGGCGLKSWLRSRFSFAFELIHHYQSRISSSAPYDLNTVGTYLKPQIISRSTEGWLVVLLFYVHGKHLRSCRDGQLT